MRTLTLPTSAAILDIGYGIGRLATAFHRKRCNICYDGFDIVKYGVEWCTKTIPPAEGYNFKYANVHNPFYNPLGKVSAQTYKFLYPEIVSTWQLQCLYSTTFWSQKRVLISRRRCGLWTSGDGLILQRSSCLKRSSIPAILASSIKLVKPTSNGSKNRKWRLDIRWGFGKLWQTPTTRGSFRSIGAVGLVRPVFWTIRTA